MRGVKHGSAAGTDVPKATLAPFSLGRNFRRSPESPVPGAID